MIDNLRSMAVFVRVAEAGSFRLAAERLGLSASVVSHHIAQLEKELGTRLLYRSTRHVAPTNQGIRFYQACRAMVDAAEDAINGLHEEQLSGRLWVVAPTPLSVGPFVDDVAEFCRQYPEVEFRLEFDDGPRNLVQEGIDVAIRFGVPPSSSLVVRPLLKATPRHYAAPSYLSSVGPITTLEALRGVQWVTISGDRAESQLTGPDGQVEKIEVRRRISVNSVIALLKFTLAGMGVAELPPMLVQQHVNSGELVEVLPEWQCDDLPCCALFPARAMPRALSRRFVDFIHARILESEAGLRNDVAPV